MDDIKTTSELIERNGSRIVKEILFFYRTFLDISKRNTKKPLPNSFSDTYLGDLGEQFGFSKDEISNIAKSVKQTEFINPRNRREIFEEMRDEYYAKHKNRRKRPTYKDIIQACGISSDRKLSEMLSYKLNPERLEVQLICMVLHASDELQNEFLASCGEEPSDFTSKKMHSFDSENDIIMNRIKNSIIQKDIEINGYDRTAIDIFNYCKRVIDEKIG